MSAIKLKLVQQTVVASTTQPLKLGGVAEDGSDAKIVIESNGNMALTQVVGIKFPAVQISSADPNTLDDYEKGSFTPASAGHIEAGAGTYTSQVGYYTKIGDMVHVHATLGWTAHTGFGNMRITGLPFATHVGSRNLATVFAQNLTYTNALSGIAVGGGNYIEFFGMLSNAYATAISLESTVYEICVSIVYKTII